MKKLAVSVIILSIALVGVFTLTGKALKAETAGSDSEILKKLDDVLGNQKAILQAMADMKQELYVIKIRVTQAQ
ncbi:MAG: hypothetical protein V1927_05175 [Candidatus Omnitrophota bacterium]